MKTHITLFEALDKRSTRSLAFSYQLFLILWTNKMMFVEIAEWWSHMPYQWSSSREIVFMKTFTNDIFGKHLQNNRIIYAAHTYSCFLNHKNNLLFSSKYLESLRYVIGKTNWISLDRVLIEQMMQFIFKKNDMLRSHEWVFDETPQPTTDCNQGYEKRQRQKPSGCNWLHVGFFGWSWFAHYGFMLIHS